MIVALAVFFFFQAEDGIRDVAVTGVQTCALPILQIMLASPTMRVVVEGHTDSVGSHDYNMKLSERRANAARDYMVAKGISASRIKTAWYGETRPVASNKTAAGRAKNRRVDIVAE